MKSVGLLIRVVCAGLMAGGQVWGAVIANYQGEYLTGQYAGQTRVQRQPDGWDYMWNSGGPIGTATNYTSLQWSTGLSVYNYDGGSPWPRGEPAAYVHLAGSGGHPGRGSTQSGGVGNTIDRYAIAAYTVQSGEQGHVYLANGSIAVASGGSNGVEVRVYVNDTLRFSRVQLGGAPTGYFGGYLGYLNAGDKVYVAVGPNNSDGADTFSSFQFILAHPDSTGDRWWDADGTAPVNGGSGTWNTTSPLWTDLPSGGTYGTWSNAANMTAHFAGTGGTVTLAEPITARALGFYTGGYTIAGTNTLTLTSSGTGSLGAATIYVENAVDTATISTPIAGSAGLIKTGAGTVVLANSSNTYTGTTYIQQGTVKLGANNAIPRIADNAVVNMRMENAVLDLNGYNEALHRIEVLGGTIQTGAGTLELTYSNSTFTSTSANSTLIAGTVKMTPNWGYFTFEVTDGPKDIDVEVSAKLTGTASGYFFKDQPGTLLLTSSQSDFSITNSVMVRRGRLFIGADAPKGAPGALGNNSAPIQLGDSLTNTTRGVWTYGAVTVGRDITVYSAPSYAAIIGGYTAHSSYFTGNITLGQNVELQAASGGTVYFTGQISESGGSFGITKTGAGTVVLQNTANTYSGSTTISGGVLSVPSLANAGVASPLGTGSSISLSSSTLQYTGSTTVSTNRSLTTSGTSIIEVPDANGQLIFTGSISSSGELRKLGAGGLQLMGSGTYGYLNVARGYVKIDAPTTTLSSGIQVGNALSSVPGGDATLDIASGSITAAWIQVGDTDSSARPVTATVNQTGGTVRTTGHPAENAGVRLGHWPWATTYYNLSGGTLIIDNNYYLTCAVDGTGTFKQTGGEAFAVRIVVNARTGSGGNGTFILEGGTFNLGSGGVVNDGTGPATVKLGGAGGILRATADWSSVLPMTLSGTGTNAIRIDTNGYTVTLSGVLSGTGGLVKTGAGTLQLNAYNTFTGGTVVQAGTLLLGAGGANGALTGELTVQSGATVNYSTNNAFGYNAGASVNKLTINGGTVGGADYYNHFWNNFQLTMTGGTLYQGGNASVQPNEWHNPTITILESAQTAQMLAVTANAAMRIRDNTPAKFDVRNGAAEVDLLVDIPITQNGSSTITKIGQGTMKVQKNITISTLYVAGGNLVLAGNSASTANFLAVGLSEPWVQGGSSPATLTIQDNASLTVGSVHMGENWQNPIIGMVAEIRQTGGTLTVTGYNEDTLSPTPYNKGALRIGHWPNETSYYYLSGGNLVIQNAEAGILLATDGSGTFYQTGGTANATFVKLNTRPSGYGTGIFTLEGGTFIIGSGGFVTDAGPYQLNLGGAGPTLRAAANWASSLNITLSGTGTNGVNIDTNGYTATLSGVLSGTGGLRKVGAGDLILSGANTYSGGTTVLAGRLLVNNTTGSGTGTGNVVVQGGLLGGNGAIGGNVLVQAGGTVSAGNSPGKLTIQGTYTQQDGGTLLVELAGYTQGGTQAVPGQWTTNGYDWVSVGGSAVLDGYVDIRLLAGFRPASGDVFNVLTAAGGITDQGLDLLWEAGSLLPGQYWTYRIISGQAGGQILQLQLGVPEPASLVLLILGAAGLLAARWWLKRGQK